MLPALAIFVVTLVLVIWQPKGLGIGWSALGGAAVALLAGVVTWVDVGLVWHIVWDATFTFVALIVISLILDEAGFFAWAASHVARLGNGRGRLLFPMIVILGAVIAAFFANDGAALLLTPIVIAILIRLEFPPAAALAFIIATGFVADTTSLPLIISNLVNIVTANYFGIGFGRYAAVMVPVDLTSLAAVLVLLWIAFRHRIPERYSTAHLKAPRTAIKDPLVFRAAFPLLAVLLIAYFATAPFGVPVSFVTGAAAVLLMAIAGRWWKRGRGAVVSVPSVVRHAPWQIVLFSLGMYMVVYGLGNDGLTAYGADALRWLAGWPRRLRCHGRYRLPRGRRRIGHEQHAVHLGGSIGHRPCTGAECYPRTDDLRERDWQRPRPEVHPDRQPSHFVVVARFGPQGLQDRLGAVHEDRAVDYATGAADGTRGIVLLVADPACVVSKSRSAA